MRALRTTLWSPVLEPSITITVRDHDLKVPLEEAAVPQPGAFATFEIFEMDDSADEVAVNIEGQARMRKSYDDERNMAMLFYYNLFSPQSDLIKRGGTMLQSRPSPLSKEQITSVFEQIAIHPRFKEKPVTMMALTRDMQIITLKPDGTLS